MEGIRKSEPLSTSAGDYLKAIWELAGSGKVTTTGVSERLSVAPGSVTRMLGRLQGMGLVRHEPYRGVSLTERGEAEALKLLRRHRLIEAFLIEYLGYGWEEVHGEAERLEHAVSDGFTERLAELLGHPDRDPHGSPIPGKDGTLVPEDLVPLSEVAVGDLVRIARIRREDTEALAYLGGHDLVPGRLLKVKEVRDVAGVVTVESEDGSVHPLGEPLARSILVQRASE